MHSKPGCSRGDKFVLKGAAGVRKQFLIMNGMPLLAFVEKKTKFHECSSFTDITANVACKEVPGLATLDPSISTTAQCGLVSN